MSEDAALFLSTKTSSNSLKDDFVCVMEMDYFELSFRLCSSSHRNPSNSTAPRVDLCAASNALHIRTCSDSFKALVELLTYYNNEGDLLDPTGQCHKESNFGTEVQYSPIHETSSEPALITTEEIVELGAERKMSASASEQLHDMVAEAMKDADFSNSCKPSGKGKQMPNSKRSNTNPRPLYDLHFAPDADLLSLDTRINTDSEFQYNSDTDFFLNQNEESATTTPLPNVPVMESYNGLPVDIQGSDEDEDEFCILENDPGVGIIVRKS